MRLRLYAALSFVALVAVGSAPVSASPEGAVAAALVSAQGYRHYLDDVLFTHYARPGWPIHRAAMGGGAMIECR